VSMIFIVCMVILLCIFVPKMRRSLNSQFSISFTRSVKSKNSIEKLHDGGLKFSVCVEMPSADRGNSTDGDTPSSSSYGLRVSRVEGKTVHKSDRETTELDFDGEDSNQGQSEYIRTSYNSPNLARVSEVYNRSSQGSDVFSVSANSRDCESISYSYRSDVEATGAIVSEYDHPEGSKRQLETLTKPLKERTPIRCERDITNCDGSK